MAFIRDDIKTTDPEIIQRIYFMGYYKIPIPTSLYLEAKEKYPEYFEENKLIKNKKCDLSTGDYRGNIEF